MGIARGWVWGIGLFFVYVASGCDPLWPDVEWRSERYVLIAIDTDEDMNLSFDPHDGVLVELVGPTVFAVGSDSRFIVVKQHPRVKKLASRFTEMNRAVTNYWVVPRAASHHWGERDSGVRGPMSKSQFDSLDAQVGLPKFQKVFRGLQ